MLGGKQLSGVVKGDRDLNTLDVALVIDCCMYAKRSSIVITLLPIPKSAGLYLRASSNELRYLEPDNRLDKSVTHEKSSELDTEKPSCCSCSNNAFTELCFRSFIPIRLYLLTGLSKTRKLCVSRNRLIGLLVSSESA